MTLRGVIRKVRKALKSASDRLEESEEEWGEYGPSGLDEVETNAGLEATIHAYGEVLEWLEQVKEGA